MAGGFLTPLAAICIAATMGVAVFVVHNQAFSLQHNGMEYALTLGLVSLGVLFIGPGKFSLDAMMPWGRVRAKPRAKSNGK